MEQVLLPVKPYKRKFLNESTKYDSWRKLVPFVNELLNQKVRSSDELLELIKKKNELQIVVEQQQTWHELQSFRYTSNEKLKNQRGNV